MAWNSLSRILSAIPRAAQTDFLGVCSKRTCSRDMHPAHWGFLAIMHHINPRTRSLTDIPRSVCPCAFVCLLDTTLNHTKTAEMPSGMWTPGVKQPCSGQEYGSPTRRGTFEGYLVSLRSIYLTLFARGSIDAVALCR